MAGKSVIKILRLQFNTNYTVQLSQIRNLSGGNDITRGKQRITHGPEFGLFFDIDGVIVRGRKVLAGAKEAFQLLTNKNGKFWVPTIFVTNAGNCLRQKKANQLSEWLDLEVNAEQVIMSHSPLKCFRQFLDKHVLVSGQGPIKDIAKYLGFKNVTTIDTLREAFPTLDMVDHKRRKIAPCAFEKYFPKIEAVILFGEPVRWETNLQLILDVLVTNGKPCEAPKDILYPHIPVLACNMDLMWMSEAPMPRFAHGCFLHCLESLYQKVTGYELKYTALVGKPSEITYHHSELVLQEQAEDLGLSPIKRMYCIGDNPDADIYGANLYNRYLKHKMEKLRKQKESSWVATNQIGSTLAASQAILPAGEPTLQGRRRYSRQRSSHGDHEEVVSPSSSRTYSIEDADRQHLGVEECTPLLVCTGVFNQGREYESSDNKDDRMNLLNHNHRDFIMDQELKRPSIIVPNVLQAVQAVFQKEGILSKS